MPNERYPSFSNVLNSNISMLLSTSQRVQFNPMLPPPQIPSTQVHTFPLIEQTRPMGLPDNMQNFRTNMNYTNHRNHTISPRYSTKKRYNALPPHTNSSTINNPKANVTQGQNMFYNSINNSRINHGVIPASAFSNSRIDIPLIFNGVNMPKKKYSREDIIRVLAIEEEYERKKKKSPVLTLKFPDLELNNDIVKTYSTFIESVHFEYPSTPRHCLVTLKDDADPKKVCEDISKISFGSGKIQVEECKISTETIEMANKNDIDPCTLYVGGFPINTSLDCLRNIYKNAEYIDLGFSQRNRPFKYVFIHFRSVDDAIEAFKATRKINGKNILVKFRREKNNDTIDIKHVEHEKAKEDNINNIHIEKSIKNNLPVISPDVVIVTDKTEIIEIDDIPDDIDSKDNVRNEILNNIKNEKIDTSSIKTELDSTISRNETPNLLGTMIKDERFDESETFTAEALYYDELADTNNPSTLDEDTILNSHPRTSSRGFKSKTLPNGSNWENLRQTELNINERKPNISTVPSVISKKTDAFTIFEKFKRKGKDDLDELFKLMNPEDDENLYF